MTKSHCSRSSPSVARDARPHHGTAYWRSVSTASAFTRLAGRDPALWAANRPFPFQLSSASAI